MKKLLIAALLIVSVSAKALAQDINAVDKKALENFETSYGGASNVQWTSTENFIKASFFQNDNKVDVFYNMDGEFMAATTQIQAEDIPASIKKSIEKKYIDFAVAEVFQYKSSTETSYFISLENAKESIVLKATGGAVSVYSKQAKN